MSSDQRSFYDALWGNSALPRSIWYGEKGKAPILREWFTDTKAALNFATSISAQPRYNVYHACALFDAEKRQQVHAKEIRAFWVDLDLKDTTCTTIKELATTYLPKFEKFTYGTDFWVVNTGRGLHVYWMFDKPLANTEWRSYAHELRDYCKANNIPVDPTRTCDSSSMMRFHPSWNLKDDEPKEVKMILTGNIHPFIAGKSPIQQPILRLDSKLKFNKEDFNLNNDLSATNFAESDANVVADMCPLIGQFRINGLDESEPLWHFALGVIHSCVDGDKFAHEFSAHSPRYNESETAQKLATITANNIRPCLCETFESHGSTFCGECPHRGKIKSPIQLGIVNLVIDDSLRDIGNAKQIKRAQHFIKQAPTKEWSIGDKGIYKLVDGERTIVTTTAFYIVDKICEDAKDYTLITAVIRAYTDTGIVIFKLPFKIIAEDSKLLGEFYARGIIVYNKKWFNRYITSYVEKLRHIKPTKAIKSLGWQEDNSFAFGSNGESYDSNGECFTSTLDSNAVDFLNGFESKGRLVIWRKAVELYNTSPFFYPHMFSILCSLGTPLLPMTGVTGFILSLQGRSGSGKSLSQELALSIWGNHLLAGCIGVKDSGVSILERLAKLKNLPARIDEATKLSDDQLSGLIYGLVNGRGRAKCAKDSSLANTAYGWQTLTLISTNRPLLEHDIAQITEAERYRILELEVKMHPNIADIGGQVGDIMKSNYGVAGKKFIKWVIQNKEETQMILDGWYTTLKSHVDDSKRFWVSAGAIALTAGQIANKIDLFDINIEEHSEWFTDILKNQTTMNESFILESRGFETKDEFVSALQDSLAGHILVMNKDGLPIMEPTKEIKALVKTNDGDTAKLYIRCPILNAFIQAHFTDSIKKVKLDLDIAESKSLRVGSRAGRFYVFDILTTSS